MRKGQYFQQILLKQLNKCRSPFIRINFKVHGRFKYKIKTIDLEDNTGENLAEREFGDEF